MDTLHTHTLGMDNMKNRKQNNYEEGLYYCRSMCYSYLISPMAFPKMTVIQDSWAEG